MDPTQPLPVPPRIRTAVTKEATMHVNVSHKHGGTEEEVRNETVRIPALGTEGIINPAYVGVNPHFTYNLGNYESLKIGIFVMVPCANTQASMDAAFERVSAIAQREMVKNFEAFKGA